MLQERIIANKAWHESTKCIEQKSLTYHKPKRTRRYDGNHVNIASFVNRFQTWQKTEHGRNRHYEGTLVSLMHSPQGNAWQNKYTYSKMACLWSYPWQEKVYSMYETTTTSLEKLNIMLTICQKYFIAKVEQDWVMLWHSIIAKKGGNGYTTTISRKHSYWTSPKYARISL